MAKKKEVKPSGVYIRLFHGRKTKDEEMNDWGEDGPFIGPLAVSWTYGCIKLHDLEWFDFEDLPQVDELIYFNGMFYGDFEILTEDDPIVIKALKKGKEIVTLEEAHTIIREQPEPKRTRKKKSS